MPATYEPIATTTLGSAAASITFSSIPSTYTDLRIIGTFLAPDADFSDINLQFNNDTNANYSYTFLLGYGTGTSSVNATNRNNLYANYSTLKAATPSGTQIDFMSYTGSTYKTCLIAPFQDFNGSGSVSRYVGLWRSTSAITSIKLFASANFNAGTTATLYGIKAA